MHFPASYFAAKLDTSDLAYPTPNGTDAASKKRIQSALNWAGNNAVKIVFDNVPMEGFKLVDDGVIKRTGWFGGNVVFRIRHPKGFEFEISSQNLGMIISHCDILHGEIQGKCLLARDGAKNAVLPENCEEYKATTEQTQRIANSKKLSLKDIKVGNYVEMKDGSKVIYYGKVRVTVLENDYNRDGSRTMVEKHVVERPRYFVFNLDTKKYEVCSTPCISALLSEKHPLTKTKSDAIADVNANISHIRNYAFKAIKVHEEPWKPTEPIVKIKKVDPTDFYKIIEDEYGVSILVKSGIHLHDSEDDIKNNPIWLKTDNDEYSKFEFNAGETQSNRYTNLIASLTRDETKTISSEAKQLLKKMFAVELNTKDFKMLTTSKFWCREFAELTLTDKTVKAYSEKSTVPDALNYGFDSVTHFGIPIKQMFTFNNGIVGHGMLNNVLKCCLFHRALRVKNIKENTPEAYTCTIQDNSSINDYDLTYAKAGSFYKDGFHITMSSSIDRLKVLIKPLLDEFATMEQLEDRRAKILEIIEVVSKFSTNGIKGTYASMITDDNEWYQFAG